MAAEMDGAKLGTSQWVRVEFLKNFKQRVKNYVHLLFSFALNNKSLIRGFNEKQTTSVERQLLNILKTDMNLKVVDEWCDDAKEEAKER